MSFHYRLSQKKVYGFVVNVHSILHRNSLALTQCASLTVLDCSLKAIADDSVIHTINTNDMMLALSQGWLKSAILGGGLAIRIWV